MQSSPRRPTNLLLLLAASATLCACTPDLVDVVGQGIDIIEGDPERTTPVGDLRAARPIKGAALYAVSADGDFIPLADVSDEDGEWGSSSLPDDEPLCVIAEGGTVNGEPFEGTLSAYVPLNDLLVLDDEPDYDFQDIEVNVMTTCVERFMDQTGADYETATERVADFFAIPDDLHPIEDEIPEDIFSEAEFIMRAADYGGFDPFVDNLVDRVDGIETLAMVPPAANAVDVVKYSWGRLAGQTILGGLGAQAAKQAFPYLLAAIGKETFEAQISRELSEIKSDLQDIKASISDLDKKVQKSIKDLKLTREELSHYIRHSAIQADINYLNTQYNELLALPDNPDKADRFAWKFEFDIKQRIDNISQAMCGSTAVVGLPAKPIVDMLIEVRDVVEAKSLVPRVLEPQGYDCFWRPSFGDDIPPWYTWCIKRDTAGQRTHHLHFGAPDFKADKLRFRNVLRTNPRIAAAYANLKRRLAGQHHHDRVAYTNAKAEFIQQTLTAGNS